MKKVLIMSVLMLNFVPKSEAQSSLGAPQNTEYAKKFDGIAGHFEYALNARERVNVNYSFSPLHPTDKASFLLHTPDPMPFWATVSDASGKVVYTWKPEQKVYLYKASWDLSKLKSGTYTVNIYLETDKASIFQYNFSK
jgi:hypothetical protein